MNEPAEIGPRVAKLEALAESADKRLESIEHDIRGLRAEHHSDFRLTWGGIITGFTITWAGIIGLALLSWNQLNDLHREIQTQTNDLHREIERLEVAVVKIDGRLDRIETSLKPQPPRPIIEQPG
jgi:hypothetical protein